MKRSILIAAGLITSLAVGAQKLQESDVPVVVKDAFKSSYKEAKEVEWEKEGLNFEAEFEIAETEQSALFDSKGVQLETEIEIKVDNLPEAVKDYISKNYPSAKIKEATKITDEKGNLSYEAEIKDKDLIFDSNGKFVKEESDKEGDKD
jgi:hypothetical protein